MNVCTQCFGRHVLKVVSCRWLDFAHIRASASFFFHRACHARDSYQNVWHIPWEQMHLCYSRYLWNICSWFLRNFFEPMYDSTGGGWDAKGLFWRAPKNDAVFTAFQDSLSLFMCSCGKYGLSHQVGGVHFLVCAWLNEQSMQEEQVLPCLLEHHTSKDSKGMYVWLGIYSSRHTVKIVSTSSCT